MRVRVQTGPHTHEYRDEPDPPRSLPCAYLGPPVRPVPCACPGLVPRACALHGEATVIGRCKACADYDPA